MPSDWKNLAEQIRVSIKNSGLDVADAHLSKFLLAAESCGSCWDIGCKDGCSGGCLSACKTGQK